jgi:hypothetical protein
MAPEVISANKSSFPADIWSIGATAVELAEGGPPYCEFPAPKAMIEISQRGFLGFRNVDYFSEAFADFVFSCMQKDPHQRPTAEELLEHAFIRQIDGLDRTETFGELPDTKIDFEQLLQQCEEEEEKPEAAEASPAGLPRPAERRTIAPGAADNRKPRTGYKTFQPPVKKGEIKEPEEIYKGTKGTERKSDAAAAPGGETVQPIVDKVQPAEPAEKPKEEVQKPAEPVEKVQQGQPAEAKRPSPLVVGLIVALVLVIVLGVRKGAVAFGLMAVVYYGVVHMQGAKPKPKQD